VENVLLDIPTVLYTVHQRVVLLVQAIVSNLESVEMLVRIEPDQDIHCVWSSSSISVTDVSLVVMVTASKQINELSHVKFVAFGQFASL